MRRLSPHAATIKAILQKAGVSVGGKNPWDIKVYNDDFYARLLSEGTLGLGESYMDGWWDVKALDQFVYRCVRVDADNLVGSWWESAGLLLSWAVLNMQNRIRAKKVAKEHYDLGNDFYMLFLGPYNQYTSLYYKGTNDMVKAEELRLKLICEKLRLKKGDRVLDIGCGWGGFAKYAAEHYGCQVTGISISDEQIKYAKAFTKDLPVKIIKKDYRDLKGEYNKIFSGGMIEHVGFKNYRAYMMIVNKLLEDDGIFLLDCLGNDVSLKAPEAWSDRYIFPNSHAPSPSQITTASEKLLKIEDWHNFGVDYDKTCMDWFTKFNNNWKKIQKLDRKFNNRFYRMWKFYLLAAAGMLRARRIHQWQIVFSKKGLLGGYQSVR